MKTTTYGQKNHRLRTYGNRNLIQKAQAHIMRMTRTKKGWQPLNMGKGPVNAIKKAEQYPDNSLKFGRWTK